MTSKERHEARYQRRRAARLERIAARNKSLEEVFTFSNLYKGYLASRNGVMWKASTQTYKAFALVNVRKAQKDVLNGTWKSKGFIEFDLMDRGKLRHIRSVHISERVVQHVLCDRLLTPVLTPSLIYDNSGSISGKGMDFALKRCSRHLREQVRKHGRELYVLTYDFSGYFDSVRHDLALDLIKRYVLDPRLVTITKQFVDAFGNIGLGLGSQVSQNIATSFPNPIDHMFKEELGVRAYARYMDDGYAIHPDKSYLEHCLVRLREECKKLGLKLNEKKTRIRKITQGFTFLKIRYTVTPTGRVLRRVCRKSVTRSRRKMKRLVGLYRSGIITLEDIRAAKDSLIGHLKRGANYYARKQLQNTYQELLKEAVKCS